MTILNSSATRAPQEYRRTIWIAACIAALVFLLINIFGATGPATDAGSGVDGQYFKSTDDMVRMVVVREWMNGQSWFDPVLHRLGFEPGTTMHWSRLIDAPIGLLFMAGEWFSAGNGEWFVSLAWPYLWLVVGIAGVLTAVRRATGFNNVVPGLIIGGFGLTTWGSFAAGNIDHHGVQVALVMWLVALLIPSARPMRDFTVAAMIMSLLLAIGMESLPIVVAGGIAVSMRLIGEGAALYEPVRRFGLALALSITVLFFALTGPQNYSATYCDSLSLFQPVCAGIGGLMLYIGFHQRVREKLPSPTIAVPLIAAAGVAGLTYIFFPACLADPMAGIDPLVREFWAQHVQETQSVFQIAKTEPFLLIAVYTLPAITIAVLIWQIIKGQNTTTHVWLLVFITIATMVTLYQMRGAQQSTAMAGLILSIAATRFMEGKGKERPLLGLLVLVVCCNMTWFMVFRGSLALFNVESVLLATKPNGAAASNCKDAEALKTLKAEQPGFIAAANGLGPFIVFNTDHRVLSGPYHRNNDGNLASIKLMAGTEAEARDIVKRGAITHYMACPQYIDEQQILDEVPNGFLGQLLKGQVPDWLEPVSSSMDKPLKLWRVRNP